MTTVHGPRSTVHELQGADCTGIKTYDDKNDRERRLRLDG